MRCSLDAFGALTTYASQLFPLLSRPLRGTAVLVAKPRKSTPRAQNMRQVDEDGMEPHSRRHSARHTRVQGCCGGRRSCHFAARQPPIDHPRFVLAKEATHPNMASALAHQQGMRKSSDSRHRHTGGFSPSLAIPWKTVAKGNWSSGLPNTGGLPDTFSGHPTYPNIMPWCITAPLNIRFTRRNSSLPKKAPKQP